VAESRLS